MRFGAALPTCAEGLGFPIGFASPDVLARIAERAEALGFYAVMANDHLSTPSSVRTAFDQPPNFYEPLTILAWCAARTERIKLMTGAIALPMREPVVLAKQVTTLDQCCDGRLIVGVAAGAHREEFEATRPDLRHAWRADMLDEGVQALRILLGERRASFHGRYYHFEDVELYPKARQPRLPLFVAGNTDRAIRRTARWGDGWLPASLPLPRLAAGGARLRAEAEEAGRDPARLSVATQLVVCLGRTQAEAEERFKASPVYEEWTTVGLSGVPLDGFLGANLIGTPEEVCRRVAAIEQAGVDHLAGLVFPGHTVDEVLDQMEEFSSTVLKQFPEPPQADGTSR
jgi:probable F420-dependent oxidoreductase